MNEKARELRDRFKRQLNVAIDQFDELILKVGFLLYIHIASTGSCFGI